MRRAVCVLVTAAIVVGAVAPAAAQVVGAVPARPSRPVVSGLAHDSVTIVWDDPGDGSVTGYQVLRRDRSVDSVGVFHVVADDTATAETTFTDGSVTASGSYVYRVRARNAFGLSPRSGFVRAHTPAAPLPPQDQHGGGFEVVWSGVLDVGLETSTVPAWSGYSIWGDLGSVSPGSFSLGGDPVRVLAALEFGGGLFLGLSRAPESEFVLRVAGRDFLASGSSVPEMAGRGRYWWPSGGGLWAEGEAVDVEILLDVNAPLAVPRPAAPPAAYFRLVPASHDGVSPFVMQLNFVGDVVADAALLAGGAVAVSGGAVAGVEAARSDGRWDVTVQPSGRGDVGVDVVGGAACDRPAALCSAGGLRLDNSASVVVRGPQWATALADLALDGAVLDIGFSPERTLYKARAAAGQAEVTVAAVAADAAATVDIAPGDADAATPGHQVEVLAGSQTPVTVTVTAAHGATMRYWVIIDREVAPGSDTDTSGAPRLTGLALAGLDPVPFSPDRERYVLDASGDVSETTLVTATGEAGATVDVLAVRGDDATLMFDPVDADVNQVGHQVSLSLSGDTLVLAVITSADGLRQRAYVVLIGSPQPQQQPPGLRSAGTPMELAKFVTAPGGAKTATDAVQGGGTDAGPSLASLSLGTVPLSPTFTATTTSYAASVAADVSQVTVDAAAASDATVAVAPADADTGTPGHQVALAAAEPGGSPTFTAIAVVVRSADASVNAYLITVERAAPPEAPLPGTTDLRQLNMSSDKCNTSCRLKFDRAVTSYSIRVPNVENRVTVTAEAVHDAATVAITPGEAGTVTAVNRASVDVNLAVDVPVTVTVTVTAPLGSETKTYTLVITRERDVPTLDMLTIQGVDLNPSFDPDVSRYTAAVDADTKWARLTLETTSKWAWVDYRPGDDDPISSGYWRRLRVGVNNISVDIETIIGRKTKTYTIAITRAAPVPDGTELDSLTLSDGDIDFDTAKTRYATTVADSVDSVTVTADADATSTVAISPEDADADAGGHQVDLAHGTNTIAVTVTSDTSMTRTYTIRVHRVSSSSFSRDSSKEVSLAQPYPSAKLWTLWSDGTTIWVTDRREEWHVPEPLKIFAYDLATGDRKPGSDIPLNRHNVRPNGLWSDGSTLWVADFDTDSLFAYGLKTGAERPDDRFTRATLRGDAGWLIPRALWSDGTTIWVLDVWYDTIFAYDLVTGARQRDDDIELASGHGMPRGMWSDGTTLWVGDRGCQNWYSTTRLSDCKIFAYDLATGDRLPGLDFNTLEAAGNGKPYGIWSDGATMWVLDADDRKLYAYNMPTNALLRSLEFDGVEIGFESGRFQYAATAPTATTTITAAASHNGATVTISPADADADTAGHQVNLAQGTNTVTVTVTNGTDTNTYTVAINRSDAATPSDDPMLSSLSIGATNIDLADRITHYTVDVAQDTSTVTVIAAASHTGADVTISPADADTDTADHQVDLTRGTNTITVTVVSESGRERHTYTIEVNRA